VVHIISRNALVERPGLQGQEAGTRKVSGDPIESEDSHSPRGNNGAKTKAQ
jgi:hypothetical protein